MPLNPGGEGEEEEEEEEGEEQKQEEYYVPPTEAEIHSENLRIFALVGEKIVEVLSI